jgi:general secretion pathway protein M
LGALVGRRGRLLAIIVLLAALGAAYLLVADPLLDLCRARQTILEQRRTLALHLGAVASELPSLRAHVAELRAAASKRRGDLFEGDSDAIASANLQKRVEELAMSVGATIVSSETLPAEPRGPYRRIGIRVGLHDKYEAVIKLLAALETATPLLVTGGLHMHGTIKRTSTSEPWRIDTSFEVYGFRNGDAPPASTRSPAGPASIVDTRLVAPTRGQAAITAKTEFAAH